MNRLEKPRGLWSLASGLGPAACVAPRVEADTRRPDCMKRLTRRAFVTVGIGFALFPRAARAFTGKRAAYKFNPRDAKCRGERCACRACYRHAANKIFATARAAQRGRAHRYCNCRVVAMPLPQHTWIALFGQPAHPHTLAVDRRSARTRAILRTGRT